MAHPRFYRTTAVGRPYGRADFDTPSQRNRPNMRRRRRRTMLPPRHVAEGGEPCLTAGERSVTRGWRNRSINRPQRGRTAPTRHYISYILSAIRGLCMAGCPRVTHGRLSAATRCRRTVLGGLLAATRYRMAHVRPLRGRVVEGLGYPRVTLADARSPAVKHGSPPSATHVGAVSLTLGLCMAGCWRRHAHVWNTSDRGASDDCRMRSCSHPSATHVGAVLHEGVSNLAHPRFVVNVGATRPRSSAFQLM